MSAETLRKAATLVRERAAAATEPRHADEGVLAWTYDGNPSGAIMGGRWPIAQASAYEYPDGRPHGRIAEHIVTWDPAAAFGVAALLDGIADDFTHDSDYLDGDYVTKAHHLALTILGEDA